MINLIESIFESSRQTLSLLSFVVMVVLFAILLAKEILHLLQHKKPLRELFEYQIMTVAALSMYSLTVFSTLFT